MAKKRYDEADAIGVAFAMGDNKKSPYAALEAAEMATNAAIAMMKVLGPRPPWNEDDHLGDWETFLDRYVKAMTADGLNTGATVQDFVNVLLVLLGRMGYLCDICGKRGVDFSHSVSCTTAHDKGLPD